MTRKFVYFVHLLAYISLLFTLMLWPFSQGLLQENKEKIQHLRETHDEVHFFASSE